jgi:hypothetical protein
MSAIWLLVTCLLAGDALGKLEFGSTRKDASRFEGTPFASLLLELGNVGAVHLRNSQHNVHTTSPRIAHEASRRSEPIANLVSEVKIPAVNWMRIDDSREPSEGANTQTMPLFLHSYTAEDDVPYTPYTEEALTIFEPRYCEMYEHIVMSGSRRFAVAAVNDDEEIMETAVVFYLRDFQKVNDVESSVVRYVGHHAVTGRVKILKVLNPGDRMNRDTYLRAEVEDLEHVVEANPEIPAEELEVKNLFREYVYLQHKMNEDVRFSTNLTHTLTFDQSTEANDDNTGLWGVITLWKQLLEARVHKAKEKRTNEMRAVQRALEARLDAGMETADSKRERLAGEVTKIIKASKDDLKISNSYPANEGMLAIIQSPSHSERLSIFKYLLDEQYRRLKTMQALQSLSMQVSSNMNSNDAGN